MMGWGLMSPAMILLLLMTVVPTLYLVYYAFRHEDLLGPKSYWVGLGNFTRVLSDPNIWSDSLSTLQFVVLAVAVELVLGLLLALMLSRKPIS
jgi:multiple sugar transport system permease protein